MATVEKPLVIDIDATLITVHSSECEELKFLFTRAPKGKPEINLIEHWAGSKAKWFLVELSSLRLWQRRHSNHQGQHKYFAQRIGWQSTNSQVDKTTPTVATVLICMMQPRQKLAQT
ncbi:hypothetical protein P4N68_05265 [Corynebacterium felinum]|uniref:Transposase DDE domain-containing protein n=1 Tax=Corynebacterium felinum TaxID=131318 RepID=A0ABU2B847_9CORY|nr:hypothetical protein [Corynebacterium felinum]MDF5820489.1 hypothetical protein [Corynebacterium felinum]MDR7354775.1 hypothetical protein [Corynebacterium felinum]